MDKELSMVASLLALSSTNPTVTCQANEKQLITQNNVVNTDGTVNALQVQFTAPTGRGNIKRVQLIATSQTLVDLNSRFVTVLINGVQVIVNEPFTKFSTFFQQITREYRVNWPEKAIVTIQVSGGTAAVQSLQMVWFFVD
jgi:hypothetical protein